MKTISRRLRILEVNAGLVETAESRLAREQGETIRQLIAEGRARVAEARARLRLSPDISDDDREDLSYKDYLTNEHSGPGGGPSQHQIIEIINEGRARVAAARARMMKER